MRLAARQAARLAARLARLVRQIQTMHLALAARLAAHLAQTARLAAHLAQTKGHIGISHMLIMPKRMGL